MTMKSIINRLFRAPDSLAAPTKVKRRIIRRKTKKIPLGTRRIDADGPILEQARACR
jgi:hypothetical protein